MRQVNLSSMCRRVGAGTAAMALLAAGAALAAPQIKGAAYSGSLSGNRSSYRVTFRVSPNGRKVTALRISNTPFFCPGGGPATPVSFASATISPQGTFTSTGNYVIAVGPLKGQIGTLLTITGKFSKHGAEHGTVTSTYPKVAACSGSTTYTARG